MRILAALLLLLPQAAPSSEPLRLPCIADTMLSMTGSEEQLNHGGRSNLRLKGIEDLTLMDFDVAPLKGRIVEEARLFVFPTGAHKLRNIGISTIGVPWKEGTNSGKPAQPGECSFMEAAAGERPWAHPGSDFFAVSFIVANDPMHELHRVCPHLSTRGVFPPGVSPSSWNSSMIWRFTKRSRTP